MIRIKSNKGRKILFLGDGGWENECQKYEEDNYTKAQPLHDLFVRFLFLEKEFEVPNGFIRVGLRKKQEKKNKKTRVGLRLWSLWGLTGSMFHLRSVNGTGCVPGRFAGVGMLSQT